MLINQYKFLNKTVNLQKKKIIKQTLPKYITKLYHRIVNNCRNFRTIE